MSLVQRLAHSTPTALYLEYLQSSWRDAARRLPELSASPPTGAEGVALMRLVVQAQNEEQQRVVARAFARIVDRSKGGARVRGVVDASASTRADCESALNTLAYEMAVSGIVGEPYAISPTVIDGPAFLIYYSPAFIRLAAVEQPAGDGR